MGIVKIPILDRIVAKRSSQLGEHPLSGYVDRLHSLYTVIMLSVFAATVGFKQYIGKPVDCMIEKQNDKSYWRAYILDYCFVKGMHRYEPGGNLTLGMGDRIDYYQWVPMFLGLEVLCFMIPHYFWVWTQSFLYIDMSTIVKESGKLSESGMLQTSTREKQLDKISDYIFAYFRYRKVTRHDVFARLLHKPCVCTVFYLITKLFYLSNSIIQLALVTFFLGFEAQWGFSMLPHLFSGSSAGLSFEYFPLKAECIYEMVDLSHVHSYRAECLLPINYVNEKIFPLLWLWLVMISIASLVDVLMFALSFFRRKSHFDAIVGLIKDSHAATLATLSNSTLSSFVISFLGADGVLLFNFIRMHAGTIAARDVCTKVYERYSNVKGFRARTSAYVPTFERPHTSSDQSDLGYVGFHLNEEGAGDTANFAPRNTTNKT